MSRSIPPLSRDAVVSLPEGALQRRVTAIGPAAASYCGRSVRVDPLLPTVTGGYRCCN